MFFSLLKFLADAENAEDEGVKKEKQEKPMLLKDYERKRLLEKGSKAYLSDTDDEEGVGPSSRYLENMNPEELTYNQEQEQLKKRFFKLKTKFTFFD